MVSAIEKQFLQSQVMERIQQAQQQHPDMQQQYFHIHYSRERRKLSKKINESDQVHHQAVDGEEERRRPHPPPAPGPGAETAAENPDGTPKQRDRIDIQV